jgi:hypothetical protein
MKETTKPADAPPPKPQDIIRQEQLAAFLNLERAVETTALSIRRRIRAGAPVETGPLFLVESDAIEDFEPAGHFSGYDTCGLGVHEADGHPVKEPAPASNGNPKPEIPDWLTETPDETEYQLAMLDHDGDRQQDIQLTRAEFEKLKYYLGRLRGFKVEETEEAA